MQLWAVSSLLVAANYVGRPQRREARGRRPVIVGDIGAPACECERP